MKTGYKATYDYICRDHKFEIGKTYELSRTPILCKYGFHYCLKPKDVLDYYPINQEFHLLEIEDLSSQTQLDYFKRISVTNKIRIIREIVDKKEFLNLLGSYHQYDDNKNLIYSEYTNGYWKKFYYDELNRLVFNTDSDNLWFKRKYNKNSRLIYYEDSFGYHECFEYDENDCKTYYKNSTDGEFRYTYDQNVVKIQKLESK
jgi:hypothetical protein